MADYLLRRLLLFPITLFCILLVNFVIINLAPGDPTTVTEISPEGLATRKESEAIAFSSDERYLQFREHYGLTLPILINLLPWRGKEEVERQLFTLVHRKEPGSLEEMTASEYNRLRLSFGDSARFVMPHLISILTDQEQPLAIRRMASRFISRGAYREAHLGAKITPKQREENRKLSLDNLLLRSLIIQQADSPQEVAHKIAAIAAWYDANKAFYHFEPTGWQKWQILFQTRFTRYFSRVITLDFGTLRNDSTKTVLSEVVKRFKYSLTLALLPMFLSFFLCQFFGFLMAYRHNLWPDYSLNLFFLILYAIPVFVVAPFLIERVALGHTFPFTDIPIPTSGFTSPEAVYNQKVSYQRLFDILQHIALPLVAIMYGTLAASARLSRTAVLEVLRQDFVRTAYAKGVSPPSVLLRHVGRNAAITIVTALAGSLGVVLGGSLIVETLFNINGFGKFFYDAVVNRDYNVILFSALAGSFLSLMGYLVADIAYTLLDPRVTLEEAG